MCFNVTNDKRKKARYDIICFKLVRSNSTIGIAESPFRFFDWVAGKKYRSTLDNPCNYNGDIHEGFHAFKTINGCRRLAKLWDGVQEYNIGIFVIPKGAEYYENDTQYVSNSMKMLIGDFTYGKQIIKALTKK